MYDIKSLEEDWNIYHKNRRKPLYIILATIIGILGISIFFIDYKNFNLPTVPNFSNNKNIATVNKKNKQVLIDNELTILQINKTIIEEEVKPEIKLNNGNDNMPTLPIVENIPIIDTAPLKPLVINTKPKIKYKKPNEPRKKVHLNIIESSSVNAYKDVEKRFVQSHDTDDSLFLAKSYFRKGQYTKSEYWSLQTNKINPNIEESWLIFVKSKVKLGRKNEAIRILTNYAKRSNASAAWNLLLKLKK